MAYDVVNFSHYHISPDRFMIDTTELKAFYGDIFTAHQNILTLPFHEMIAYLQKQFNHVENATDFNDKAKLEKEFRLLTSEANETRNDGLIPKNLKMIRDGIADQLTIAYFLAFKVNGFTFENVEVNSPTPKSYTEYCEATEKTIEELKAACFTSNDLQLANEKLNHLIAQLWNKPDFSAFSIEVDLIDVTLSSLSKVCTASESETAEQVAERTLAAYKERGYIAHISKTEAGYGIFITEDCVVKGENYPAGKFLKSLYYVDALLPDVREESVW